MPACKRTGILIAYKTTAFVHEFCFPQFLVLRHAAFADVDFPPLSYSFYIWAMLQDRRKRIPAGLIP